MQVWLLTVMIAVAAKSEILPEALVLGSPKTTYSSDTVHMPIKVFFCRDLEGLILYCVYGVSVPSLHRESTDSIDWPARL